MRTATVLEHFVYPEHWNDTGIGEYLSPISNDYGSEYGEQLQFLNAWGEYYVDEMEKDTALRGYPERGNPDCTGENQRGRSKVCSDLVKGPADLLGILPLYVLPG